MNKHIPVLVALLTFGSINIFGIEKCNQHSKNPWNNCLGIIKLPNGDQFTGVWKDDIRVGQGIFTYGNGERREGEWKDGFKHGQGIYTWANGDRYEGEYKDGYKQQGIYTWANGDKFEGEFKVGGEWKENVRHGQGIYTWSNGDRYEGEYKGGKRIGQGIYTWANGDIFEGEYEDNLRWGLGKEISSSGQISEGLYKGGVLTNNISVVCKIDLTAYEAFQIDLIARNVKHEIKIAKYDRDGYLKEFKYVPSITYDIDFMDDWVVHFANRIQIDLKTKTKNKEYRCIFGYFSDIWYPTDLSRTDTP